MKSLPWLRVACSLVCGGLAFFLLWHAPWLRPRAVLESCLDDEFEFSPDSQRLVVWPGLKLMISSTIHFNEPGIRSYGVATGMKSYVFEESGDAFFDHLIFSPDGRFAAGSTIAKIFVWDAATGSRIPQNPPAAAWVMPRVFFSSNGELLSTAAGTTKRLRDGETIAEFYNLIEDARVWVAAQSGPLAGYATAEEVRVIDRSTGRKLRAFPLPGGGHLYGHRIWGDGTVASVYRKTFKPFVAAAPRGRECFICVRGRQWPVRMEALDEVDEFSISPDGQWVAYSEPVTQWTSIERTFSKWFARPLASSVLRIDRLEDGENSASIRDGRAARVAPDGRTLAVSFADGRIELWDFPLRKPTLLIVLLSVLVSVSIYTGSRWWQKRRRAVQTATVAPSGLRPVGTADNSPAR